MKRTASVMPPALRAEITADPEYLRCGLATYQHIFGSCGGRVTREHAIIFAGSKVQKKWAIPPCCAAHHGVDEYQDAGTEASKEVRVWMAVNRATDEELLEVSKAVDYIRMRSVLNAKYGVYVLPPIPQLQAGNKKI
jgi:hypothetical protein